ncbi:SH3 domain-containing protein [Variovorax sp. J22G21]|uniref:SH3 domain-containing protein n=1 Tax=Variovorax fucosicus TaxID=3053517 RepID=UPI0025758169|nr:MULTISPECIES: SH3 domain-containing protein [unclassified Variovorax]MDM0039095.1 SH3 domain-containing protein [Variovorax sp. J22R193]MDM0063871.1 SH3 domain-containing protein [Variovorax sp. J22G21]
MNNQHVTRWLAVGAVALALPLAAAAQEAYTRGPVNLRAGPSNDYPSITRLRPGQPLEVLGCTSGYGWCDVVLPDGLRGWAAAQRLEYPYRGGNVPLATYGATIGVPIISFNIGSYWGDHYRDRSWYGDRRWWGNRPPPPPQQGWRPPPPPRASWQPRPVEPGYRPERGYDRPEHGYNRPQPEYRQQPGGPGYGPDPGYRQHPGDGQRPPRDPGFRAPQPGPGIGHPGPGVMPPQQGGGRPNVGAVPTPPAPPNVNVPQAPRPYTPPGARPNLGDGSGAQRPDGG